MDEKLRWTEERFRLMVDGVADCAMVMLDPDGCVASWNGGAQQLEGYSSDEIVGQHFSRFYLSGDVDKGKPERDLSVATAEGRFEDEGWRRRKDGSVFWAAVVSIVMRDRDGGLRGFASFTRDLTERRQVEADLTQAKVAAERANVGKSEFLASISHDLRTPLNAILGFAQLMESDAEPPSPSQQASLDQILQAGWSLLELINEIKDLALIESGELSLSPEPLDLRGVFLECQATLDPQASKRGVQVTFPEQSGHHVVVADRTRVRQALLKLCSNAMKSTDRGGTVVVGCTSTTPNRIRVTVTDSGAGLPPERLAELFRPVDRPGQQATTQDGTGMGLKVTRQLVELMGGTIGAESTVGAGRTFWFELPSTAAPETASEATAAAPALRDLTDATRTRTLLYVEDNPASLQLVEQLVARRADMRLLSAVDGDSGVALARATQPDVILMDINLPGISGLKALAFLRGHPTTAHIPVIALSANASPGDVTRGMKAGFCKYLTKPIRLHEFMNALDEALALATIGLPRAS